MTSEIWRFTYGNCARFDAAAVFSDGSLLAAGWEGVASPDGSCTEVGLDFVAFKLDAADGTVLWKWKEGTEELDSISAAGGDGDGSMFLVGSTYGNWSVTNEGDADYAAVKLNSDGDVVWRLQGGSAGHDELNCVAISPNGYAFLGGGFAYDFFLIKVDNDGNVLWDWKGDSGLWDSGNGMTMAGADDSIVLVGATSGDWAGATAGETDFAAVKVDSNGKEVWRWQNGTREFDYLTSVLEAENGAIVMSGSTEGSFSRSNADLGDVMAIKLDASGSEQWRWQNGTSGMEYSYGSATGENDSVVMAGFTTGHWSGQGAGVADFMAVKLDTSNGVTEAWRWQNGTSGWDVLRASSAGPRGIMILAGYIDGSLGRNDGDGTVKAVALLLRTSLSGPAPARRYPAWFRWWMIPAAVGVILVVALEYLRKYCLY